MENFTPIASLVGGIIIGLAAAGLFYFNGKILGISNISTELLNPRWHRKQWRLTFILGLLTGGLILTWFSPELISTDNPRSYITLVFAGLLVGYGSSLGRGCTSGHGVCGISRLAPRSILATLTFMATGIITATITNLLTGNLT